MMTYLFGDSTPSPLTSNFLEFFRDAVDFSVFALQTDERIKQGRERARALRREADAEMERLGAFVGRIAEAIDEGVRNHVVSSELRRLRHDWDFLEDGVLKGTSGTMAIWLARPMRPSIGP